jgi:hypothetical protein
VRYGHGDDTQRDWREEPAVLRVEGEAVYRLPIADREERAADLQRRQDAYFLELLPDQMEELALIR